MCYWDEVGISSWPLPPTPGPLILAPYTRGASARRVRPMLGLILLELNAHRRRELYHPTLNAHIHHWTVPRSSHWTLNPGQLQALSLRVGSSSCDASFFRLYAETPSPTKI